MTRTLAHARRAAQRAAAFLHRQGDAASAAGAAADAAQIAAILVRQTAALAWRCADRPGVADAVALAESAATIAADAAADAAAAAAADAAVCRRTCSGAGNSTTCSVNAGRRCASHAAACGCRCANAACADQQRRRRRHRRPPSSTPTLRQWREEKQKRAYARFCFSSLRPPFSPLRSGGNRHGRRRQALRTVAIGGSPKDQRMDHGCILRRPHCDPPHDPGDRRPAIP